MLSPSNAIKRCRRHQTPPPPPPLNAVFIVHRRHRHHCRCCRHHHQRCWPLHHYQLTKKEAAASPPPAYQWQHQNENLYKSRRLGLILLIYSMFGPEFWCLSLNFLEASGELKCLVLFLHTRWVPEATGKKMAERRQHMWRSREVFLSLVTIEGSNTQGKSLRKNLYQAYDVRVFLRIVDLLACQKWHACISFPPKKGGVC